ncbi:MAG: hypothetical protein KF753_02065 [Caldilineaceae bacterium]|nr:hypothetical protein [Caldilineaceae bacterium]
MATQNRNEDNRVGSFTWAGAFVLGGLGLLLYNLGTFTAWEPYLQYVLAGLLGLASIGFFASYFSQTSNWWRLIPAWTLLALAGMVYLTTVQSLDQRVTAGLLFVGQALAFAHIYLLDRDERWWAVIPGGFMLVLGGVIALSSRTENPDTLGTLLFVGLGGVFFLLYLLGRRARLWWALIPGVVLVVFGLFLFSVERSQENVFLAWWPVLLLLFGLFLGWRATARKPGKEKLTVNSASNLSRHGTAKSGASSASGPPRLGEYKGPAPGATVDVLADPDE